MVYGIDMATKRKKKQKRTKTGKLARPWVEGKAGRPPYYDRAMDRVYVYLPAETFAAIDRLRGDQTRGAYVSEVVIRAMRRKR
jgi:hypothetical protein